MKQAVSKKTKEPKGHARDSLKKPETAVISDRPELAWIKLSQLYIPTNYQRSVKSDRSIKNIGYIQNNFNWADCGALIVCRLADSNPVQYAVIDGQHRYRAAEARGDITELPCVVINPRAEDQQARNFVNINSRRVKLNPLQEYHAAVVGKDPDAVALDEILRKCDIAIAAMPISNSEMHPRVTCAVGTLLKMISEYSERQITWAITIIPEAFGDAKGQLRASLIKTMAEYIKRHADTDRATMIEALRRIDIDDLEKDARTYRAIHGGSTKTAMMCVIEKKYNQVKRIGAK